MRTLTYAEHTDLGEHTADDGATVYRDVWTWERDGVSHMQTTEIDKALADLKGMGQTRLWTAIAEVGQDVVDLAMEKRR